MNARKKAEDFFWTMLNCRKSLAEIPQSCSQGENGLLIYLSYIQDNITPSELSEKMNVSLPRITSILNSLENKDYIIKNVSADDKRKCIISITEFGKKLVSDKRDDALNKLTCVLEKLEEQEVDEYIRLTKKIVNIIENNK